jgi:hypothetical protein
LAGNTGLAVFSAWLAVFGGKTFLMPEVIKSGNVFDAKKVNASAITAVTAVRPAFRNILFPMKGNHPIPAVSSLNLNLRFIN